MRLRFLLWMVATGLASAQTPDLTKALTGPFWEHYVQVGGFRDSNCTVTVNGQGVQNNGTVTATDNTIKFNADCLVNDSAGGFHGVFSGQLQINIAPDSPVLP